MDDFYTKTYYLKRKIRVADTQIDELVTIAEGLCHIQMQDDRSQLQNQNDWGKEYMFYAKANVSIYNSLIDSLGYKTNPSPNDVITINDVDYGVTGVSYIEDPFEDKDQHLHMIITRKTSELYIPDAS
jgi:hypothetical protein